MWCSSCHQDVAGVLNSERGRGYVCGRCGQLMGQVSSLKTSPETYREETSVPEALIHTIEQSNQSDSRSDASREDGDSTVLQTNSTANSLAALDREIDAFDTLLENWPGEASRSQTVDEEPIFEAVQPVHPKPFRKKMDPLTLSVGTTRQQVQRVERQVSLLLIAQITFFVGAALTSLWALPQPEQGLGGQVVADSNTGQLGTLFCLAWFVSRMRSIQQRLSDAEMLIIKQKLERANPPQLQTDAALKGRSGISAAA